MKHIIVKEIEDWIDPVFQKFWIEEHKKPITLDNETKQMLDDLTEKIIKSHQASKKNKDESTNQG